MSSLFCRAGGVEGKECAVDVGAVWPGGGGGSLLASWLWLVRAGRKDTHKDKELCGLLY